MASGIPTNRTNIELPNAVSSEILQKTQESSAVMKLARQIPLPGNGLQIPVITGDPTADWVTETGRKPVSNPSLSKKIMQAHKLAVIVPFSNEFRRDAAALYNALIQRLPNALGKKFDETVFFGPGSTLANFDDFSQVTTQALDAANKTAYDGIVAAEVDINSQGGVVNGYVFSPQGRGVLLSAVGSDKRPLFNDIASGDIPRILGAPLQFSAAAYKAGAAGVGTAAGTPDILGFAGDWTKALYGMVEGVKIDFADQATLTVQEGTSVTTIDLWQRNMFAVRAEVEIGFVAQTAYFNALTRVHAAS
jgi:HK97 family phage major capsid protein